MEQTKLSFSEKLGYGVGDIYAYVTYLILNIIYSGANVPYGVLNSLIT
ncbi:hypothetical protein AB4Z50_17520 [Paenibacillus sp. 2TAB26]